MYVLMRGMHTILSSILVTCLSAALHAQQSGGTSGSVDGIRAGSITGLIKYPDLRSAEGVTVFLLRLPDSSLVKVSLSDKNGAYEFERLRKGNYVLRIEAVGYHRSFSPP